MLRELIHFQCGVQVQGLLKLIYRVYPTTCISLLSRKLYDTGCLQKKKMHDQNLCKESIGGIFISRKKLLL